MSSTVVALATKLGKMALCAEPLARHCTIKVGGPACLWVQPETEEELQVALAAIAATGCPMRVWGAGSNLLPADEGFEGAVLHLGRGFDTARAEGQTLVAGGAALLPRLTHFSLKHALGGLEWACGIPGTVGGSVWGNAGARGFDGATWVPGDAAGVLAAVVAYGRDGLRRELARDAISFAYRASSLDELVVTQATFALAPLTPERAATHRAAVTELLARRRATQPVSAASAGCVWKNPKAPGCAGAGELIERLGLKGASVGDASVSQLHGNFIVNNADASGRDVRELMQLVERTVLAQSGIVLEREVRCIDG